MKMLTKNNAMRFPFKKIFLIWGFVILCVTAVNAQKDTSKPQSVTIISAYKPVLRNAAKMNFSGSNLLADSSKHLMPYIVPVQNLVYAYQPINLKPLSVQNDTLIRLGTRYYVKAGFGNYTTPYLNAAASFGDGETTLINIYGNYISSKGKIANQDYSDLSIKGKGSYFLSDHEIYASAGLSRKDYFLYGYNHDLYNYDKDQVRQQFQNFEISAGIRNTVKRDFGINYNPNFKFSLFSNKDYLTEATVQIQLPTDKKINEWFTVKANASFDFTHTKTQNFIPVNFNNNNNVIKLSPSLFYKTDLLKINGGFKLISNNGKLLFLPEVYGELAFLKEKFLLQGGWVGDVQKNNYLNLTNINPYISPFIGSSFEQYNTVQTELYGGIKSSIGKHVLFSAKASFIKYKNFALFINDTNYLSDGKRFLVSYEKNMDNFSLHGDISYIIRDVFKLTGGIVFNGYTGMSDNGRAWNTVPVECTAAMRWTPYKKVTLKGDFYFFGGGHYLDKGNISRDFNGAADLSAGIDYKINKQFGAFINLNNIFGKNYERWHGYPVYGFNVLGGLSLQF